MHLLRVILIQQRSPDTYPIILYFANQLFFIDVKQDIELFVPSIGEQTMPDGIFDQRLNEHGRDPDLIDIYFFLYADVVIEVGKSQLLHFQVAFKILYILPERNKRLTRMFEVQAYQLRKPAQIE